MTALRRFGAIGSIALISLLMLGCGDKTKVVVPPPPEVFVSHPLKKEVTQFLEFAGTTAALEYVEIRARVEGFLEKIEFEPGAMVKKGDPLFLIDPRPFQAQVDQAEASLRGAEADLQLKTANFKRAEQLLSTASISQLQYDIQNADETVAKAKVGISKADLEKAKLDLSYTNVTAPINGRVGRNLVDLGNLVGAKDKTLLTDLVNDSSIYVYFDVSELALLRIMRMYPNEDAEQRRAQDRVPAFLQLADETGFPHQGKIDFIESRVDPSTGTLRVRAVFPNGKGMLVAGLFGRVRVPIQQKMCLLAPEIAVGIGQGGRYVLVVNKDNVVEQKTVKTGQLEGTMRVIEEGLDEKDRIVVNAIQRARPGSKVTPKESPIESPTQASEKAAPASQK